jgi:hypothetical protein
MQDTRSHSGIRCERCNREPTGDRLQWAINLTRSGYLCPECQTTGGGQFEQTRRAWKRTEDDR